MAAQISSAMTVVTAACALLISGLSLKVTRDGQITSRYSSAVEQLGGGNLETKIGAIYALGRLAVDSEYDRPAVTSLLTDYVRAKAVKEVTAPDVPHSCRFSGATPMDVVAALRVMFYDLADKRSGGRSTSTGSVSTRSSFPPPTCPV